MHVNEIRLDKVNSLLTTLGEKIVFVGGATLSLYVDAPILEIRPTRDVDVVLKVINYGGYAALEERLRLLGFRNDVESGVIGRYLIDDIIVDFMPVDDQSLGFSNRWYKLGFDNSITHKLSSGSSIQIFTAPNFLASKFEAFKGRGKYNGITSHDFEDIVFILENRESIWSEIASSAIEVKAYLKDEFSRLLQQPAHTEWIAGHVERSASPATYRILDSIRVLISA